jgi:membrane protein involved in colicin uptake
VAAELEQAADAVKADMPADDAAAARQAADALAWLDVALNELRGALTACAGSIDAGKLDPAVVSGRMNALVMEMMAGGTGPAE